MTGTIVLGVALLASAVLGVWYQRRNGRFTPARATSSAAGVDEPVVPFTPELLGGPLGERATFVQFSSAFCAPCRATRALLTDVASRFEGVRAVEIDAESHLDLVRRLDVMRTPTTFVLDARGAVVTRASGLPKRDQVMAVLAGMAGDGTDRSQIMDDGLTG